MTNELPGSTVKSLARKPEQRPRSSRESSRYLLALNQLSSSQKGLPPHRPTFDVRLSNTFRRSQSPHPKFIFRRTSRLVGQRRGACRLRGALRPSSFPLSWRQASTQVVAPHTPIWWGDGPIHPFWKLEVPHCIDVIGLKPPILGIRPW